MEDGTVKSRKDIMKKEHQFLRNPLPNKHTSDEHRADKFPRCISSLLFAGKTISCIHFANN
jgi:hypothetical protein